MAILLKIAGVISLVAILLGAIFSNWSLVLVGALLLFLVGAARIELALKRLDRAISAERDDYRSMMKDELRPLVLIEKETRNGVKLLLKRDERERARAKERYERTRKAIDASVRSIEQRCETSNVARPAPSPKGGADGGLRGRLYSFLQRFTAPSVSEDVVAPARVSPIPESIATAFSAVGDRVSEDWGVKTQPRVLFITSNGAGLGHLTRVAAIERHMNCDTMIYTMSSAYHHLGKPNREILYFPSHGDLGMDGKLWNRLSAEHLETVLRAFDPDLVVFDGSYVYQSVIRSTKALGKNLVWIQRGCWRREIDQSSKQRHDAHKFATAVIIPGDYGCDEQVDVGDCESVSVNPIVALDRHEVCARDAARKHLGLPQDKKLFLIQLGAGTINEIDDLQTFAVETVKSLGREWQPVLVRNPLKDHQKNSGVLSVKAYPLSRYYSAFDAGIFAAGYNTVQESVAHRLPGVFVPNLHTKTDDQLRRAQGLETSNMGLIAIAPDEVKEAIISLSEEANRDAISARMSTAPLASGGEEAAAFLGKKLESWTLRQR